jgi:hypothetical protein
MAVNYKDARPCHSYKQLILSISIYPQGIVKESRVRERKEENKIPRLSEKASRKMKRFAGKYI